MSPSRCVLNSYTSHPCLLMIHLYLDVITNLVCQENFENCCYLVTSQCRLALMVTYVQHPFSEAPVIVQSHLMFLSYPLSTSPPLCAAYHVSSNRHGAKLDDIQPFSACAGPPISTPTAGDNPYISSSYLC